MKGYILGLSLASCLALAFSAGCGSSGGSGGSTTECFSVSGSGTSDEECGYSGSSLSGYACPATTKSGSCPSSGLIGCCGGSESSDGDTVISGICYYSSSVATMAKSACKSPETWSTTAP